MGVFVDASFATSERLRSQLGSIVCLIDNNHNVNIVHYASVKCKHIARSVRAAELGAFGLGFDQGFPIRTAVKKILQRTVEMKIYTDSKRLFDALTSLNSTMEKRLLIDLSMPGK